jgi:hypothetical protein
LLAHRRVDNSKGHSRDAEQGGEPGQQHKPLNSMTLQTAPLLPNGTTWKGSRGQVRMYANVSAWSLLLPAYACSIASLHQWSGSLAFGS